MLSNYIRKLVMQSDVVMEELSDRRKSSGPFQTISEETYKIEQKSNIKFAINLFPLH